jgi:hypothetical protein
MDPERDLTNLGSQIVAQLGRRGLSGKFFDFAGYQQLRQVENSKHLCQFLLQYGYQSPPRLGSAEEAVDYLIVVNKKMEQGEAPWFWAAIVTGAIAPFVDLFFWLGALVLRRNRSSRKRL